MRFRQPWGAGAAGASFGNGAAMRVAPVGAHFADEEDLLLAEATRRGRIAHAHPLGIAGAVAQAAAVGAAVRGDDSVETAIRVTREPAPSGGA
jgi:ADP-ribosylglycohydrolase